MLYQNIVAQVCGTMLRIGGPESIHYVMEIYKGYEHSVRPPTNMSHRIEGFPTSLINSTHLSSNYYENDLFGLNGSLARIVGSTCGDWPNKVGSYTLLTSLISERSVGNLNDYVAAYESLGA